MSKLIASCLFVTVTTLTANARLGETLNESIARYGNFVEKLPTLIGSGGYVFLKDKYAIDVELDNSGRTWWIEYTKRAPKGGRASDTALSDNEIHNFMKSEGGTWKQIHRGDGSVDIVWQNEQGKKAEYRYGSDNENLEDYKYSLRFWTEARSHAFSAYQKKHKNKAQEGF
jgi:hypothetical protein